MADLDQLKSKYQSVLDFIKQSNVSLSHLHVQDNKLFMQGAAPSEKIKNMVWDKIKAVDPSYSDLTADLTVDSSIPEPSMPSSSDEGASGGYKEYTVKPGDSLWKIAQDVMGNGASYPKIVAANPDKLKDEHTVIHPGDVLKVPTA